MFPKCIVHHRRRKEITETGQFRRPRYIYQMESARDRCGTNPQRRARGIERQVKLVYGARE